MILPPEMYDDEINRDRHLACVASDYIAIATTTFYPSKNGEFAGDVYLRAQLALEMLKKATDFYLPVYVVDGGSDNDWRSEVESLGVTLLDEVKTEVRAMGPGRRQALTAAGNSGKNIIVWMEPEKYPFIVANEAGPLYRLPIGMTATPIYAGEADIVVPRREDELASYPAQQRFEEITGNLTVMDLLRGYVTRNGSNVSVPYMDYWFGPRAMNKDGLDYFLKYDGKIGDDHHDNWEAIFIPVWQALLDGKRVVGTSVPYVHPQAQTELEGSKPEYSLKRVKQLSDICQAVNKFVGSFKTAN